MTELRERSPIERLLGRYCPADTNGDGDCGQYLCPWCGTSPSRVGRRFRFVRTTIKEMAADIWGDRRITEHATAALVRTYTNADSDAGRALMTLLALNWGWEACNPEEWAGPAEFLDEHLHYTRGAKHTDLIGDLRDLAVMLDPDQSAYPGGRANLRPRHPKAVTL